MRKLVTIQKIKEVRDIPNKDIIGVATFESVGYQVIVDKTVIKKGDLVAYFMVDSLLPDVPEFQEIKKYSWKPNLKKCRIKCISMSKVFSEGLVMPLDKLKNLLKKDISSYEEGEEITEDLGVGLFSDELDPIPVGVKGSFPSILQKTDETRIHDFPEVLEYYRGEYCYITEKIDGTSITVFLNQEDEFIIASRNLTIEKLPIIEAIDKYNSTSIFEESNLSKYFIGVSKLNLPEKFLKYKERTGNSIAIQGELAGGSIQKNRLSLKGIDIFMFNGIVISDNGLSYMSCDELKSLSKEFEINMVPIIKENFYFDFNNLNELIDFSKGKSLLNKDKEREGIVIRFNNFDLLRFTGMNRNNFPSFKVLNPKYLLKLEEEFSKEN